MSVSNQSPGFEPFRLDIAQQLLDDMRTRVERGRFVEELPDVGWDYGGPLGLL